MESRSERRGVAGQAAGPVPERPATLWRASVARRGIGRRDMLLVAPGALLSVALTACADKPPPAEVTPFAFPAVGAGQKDTAQFGARSGPTVP